ncbi:MAG: UDP-N-acetylmuramoyl-L-alanine--D-glutamate ligase [Chlamydiota bacterium]|jgi:UDP-N-acetylmuramoylalanine--D-glutamate ligase
MDTLILGSGKSGVAAHKFLLSLGEKSIIYDDFLKQITLEEIEKTSFKQAIISPGFSPDHKVVRYLNTKGIPIIGEMELGLRYTKTPCVAVTGTNGKTTVCLIASFILNQWGVKTKAVGNVGVPLTEYLLQDDPAQLLILETSSYQLETMQSNNIEFGLILNITPHHLDRYDSFLHYVNTKMKLAKLVKKDCFVIKHVYELFQQSITNVKIIPDLFFSSLRKDLLQENLCAAFTICNQFGVTKEFFENSLVDFQKPEHRLEWVASISGRNFYNDSKATNVSATIKAVESFQQKIILIAGGYDCLGDFSKWTGSFSTKVKKMYCYGDAAKKIFHQLKNTVDVEVLDNLEACVKKAYEISLVKDVILLSPGCPSFGCFKNYEQRGEAFKNYIKALKKRML